MSKPVTSYFSLSHGLRGCYLPDSQDGAYAVTKRHQLVEILKYALESYDAPACRIRDIKIRRLWAHMSQHGASVLHFTIDTTEGYCVSFSGMTEAEYTAAQEIDA